MLANSASSCWMYRTAQITLSPTPNLAGLVCTHDFTVATFELYSAHNVITDGQRRCHYCHRLVPEYPCRGDVAK